MSDNKKLNGIPINYRDFILSYSNDPEDCGWDRDDVLEILGLIQAGREDELDLEDPNLVNDIGTWFNDGVCTDIDIEKAVYWYERAIALDDDLARSNLADILRKGSHGYPKDLSRAFQLYSECGLPYAHYRCGEFLEHGWGVEKDLGKARTYYQLAYKEGHHLAKKKLDEWDFMNE